MLTLIVGLTLVALLGYSAFVVIVIARAEPAEW